MQGYCNGCSVALALRIMYNVNVCGSTGYRVELYLTLLSVLKLFIYNNISIHISHEKPVAINFDRLFNVYYHICMYSMILFSFTQKLTSQKPEKKTLNRMTRKI